MNSNQATTQTTPSGAPKLSRYMARIEAKRMRRLNPHPLRKRATQRRCAAQHIITARVFAGDHNTSEISQ